MNRPSGPDPKEDTMTEEAAVRAVIDERIAATRTGDAKTICARFTPDAVVYDLAPPLAQPGDAARDVAALQAWFDEKGGHVWADVQDVRITVDGDLALVSALESMGAPPEAPQPFTLWFRSTLGLRRVGGDWRIVHEHRSTPFHMETTDGTFRAATDLQP
jgi:uncharacterized protein (TIGR02246 family)